VQIYRIDHVAQAVPDLEQQISLLENVFGFRVTHRWDHAETGVRGARLEIPGTWGHAWQVLAPAGESSAIQTWLDEHGGRPGLHHIGVEVPDLDAAVSELDGRGIKLTDGVPGKWAEASLSPPQHGPGVLFRLRGPGTLAMTGDEAAVTVPSTVPDGPTLGIVNLDHVCQAFLDRDELSVWYQDLLGCVEVWRTADDEHPDMADLVLNVPGSSICLEVIMPRGEDSFIEKFFSRNGAAAHHVTFQVSDWDAARDACRFHDVPTFDDEHGITDGARWRHTFIHPKQTGGVLVQLFWEERPGVWVRSDKVPGRRR
jgi:methylmalonyl-CoA/ethylmalonyl-CoA epimerase